MTREELDKARKELKIITKRIGDAVMKQRELQETVSAYEKLCRHIWSKRVYIQKNDHFERECSLCGMIKHAKE